MAKCLDASQKAAALATKEVNKLKGECGNMTTYLHASQEADSEPRKRASKTKRAHAEI